MSDQVFGDDFDDEDDFDGGGRGGGNRMLFIIIGIVLLLIALVAGVYFSGILDSFGGGDQAPQVEQSEQISVPAGPQSSGDGGQIAGPGAEYYELTPVLVNLRTENARNKFLRLVVTLQLARGASFNNLENAVPQLLDSFQIWLRDRSPSELVGSAGVYILKEELLARANKTLNAPYGIEVRDILIQEMLVQ